MRSMGLASRSCCILAHCFKHTPNGAHLHTAENCRDAKHMDWDPFTLPLSIIGHRIAESNASLAIHVGVVVRNLRRLEMVDMVEWKFSRGAQRWKIVRLPAGLAGNGCR